MVLVFSSYRSEQMANFFVGDIVDAEKREKTPAAKSKPQAQSRYVYAPLYVRLDIEPVFTFVHAHLRGILDHGIGLCSELLIFR